MRHGTALLLRMLLPRLRRRLRLPLRMWLLLRFWVRLRLLWWLVSRMQMWMLTLVPELLLRTMWMALPLPPGTKGEVMPWTSRKNYHFCFASQGFVRKIMERKNGPIQICGKTVPLFD